MTEQERERLIEERVELCRMWRDHTCGQTAYNLMYSDWKQSFPLDTDDDEIYEVMLEAERRFEARFGVELVDGQQPFSVVTPHTAEEVSRLEEAFLRHQRGTPHLVPDSIGVVACQYHVFTPDTERMLARLVNPTTLGERLCRAFLMGDEDSLKVLLDGIQLGEIEVQP